MEQNAHLATEFIFEIQLPSFMNHSFFRILAILLVVFVAGCQKKASSGLNQKAATLPSGTSVWVSFYNVENLFDPHDDAGKDDSEYLPGSELDWTSEKYVAKLDNLTQAVKAMNNGKGPDILGLAEVENLQTLEDWTTMTELKSRGYQFVIEEGPDPRGIDCAFMYDPAIFVYKSHEAKEVAFPEEPGYITRLVLKVDGEINGEAISFVVIHWPSRRGGQEESEFRRVAAAKATRELIEQEWSDNSGTDIIVMGDFNDDPFDKSVAEVLKAKTADADGLGSDEFLNPVGALHDPESTGTLTYQGKWNLFDQVLISQNLTDEDGVLEYVDGSAGIHNPEFMQVGGDGRSKDMPRRGVYRGEFQERGFSDHFPVYVRLRVR